MTQKVITAPSHKQAVPKQARLVSKKGKLVRNPRPVICGINVSSTYLRSPAAAIQSGSNQPVEKAVKRNLLAFDMIYRGGAPVTRGGNSGTNPRCEPML